MWSDVIYIQPGLGKEKETLCAPFSPAEWPWMCTSALGSSHCLVVHLRGLDVIRDGLTDVEISLEHVHRAWLNMSSKTATTQIQSTWRPRLSSNRHEIETEVHMHDLSSRIVLVDLVRSEGRRAGSTRIADSGTWKMLTCIDWHAEF